MRSFLVSHNKKPIERGSYHQDFTDVLSMPLLFVILRNDKNTSQKM